MTQGRASYTMEFSRYEGVPPDISLKVLETAQRAKEEASAHSFSQYPRYHERALAIRAYSPIMMLRIWSRGTL